mmetsp:Transcript_12077/g.29267  ORF Transcript_12077/g.29267 Transcript_12077/m.29267 type:complete len:237 (-) Transcript_12077:25-735(-)
MVLSTREPRVVGVFVVVCDADERRVCAESLHGGVVAVQAIAAAVVVEGGDLVGRIGDLSAHLHVIVGVAEILVLVNVVACVHVEIELFNLREGVVSVEHAKAPVGAGDSGIGQLRKGVLRVDGTKVADRGGVGDAHVRGLEAVVELALGHDVSGGVVGIHFDSPVAPAVSDKRARGDGFGAVSVRADEPMHGDGVAGGGVVVGVLGVFRIAGGHRGLVVRHLEAGPEHESARERVS